MAKAPKMKAATGAPETDGAAVDENAVPSMPKGDVNSAPPDEGGDDDSKIPETGEKDALRYRILSPLKCGGVVWAAGDEVTLELGEDELALLVVEGLIEALEV